MGEIPCRFDSCVRHLERVTACVPGIRVGARVAHPYSGNSCSLLHALVAQWIERLASNERVEGSSPSGSTLEIPV